MRSGYLAEATMSMDRRWVAVLLALSALTACATTVPSGSALPTQRTYVIGSRVAVPVDPSTGLPQTASPLQIVTQDDIKNTGRVDLGSALRMLVPALH
jgi:hypothetical protein